MRRSGPLVVAAIAAGTWLLFGRLLAPFDLMAFLTAGRQVLHGYSPYVAVTTDTFRAGRAYVYPYAVAWLFAPLAALPTHTAVLAYSALSVGAIVSACHLLRDKGVRAAVALLVCSTTIVGLQMGTLNALLMLGLAAAWKYRDRPIVCGVVVGVLAVAKLFLAPVAVWLVLRRRFRAAVAAALTGGVALTAGFAFGPIGPARYAQMLSALQGQETTRSWSMTSLLRNVGLGPHAALAGTLVIGASVMACGYRLGRGEAPVFGAAVLASLVISPIVWSSYLVLLAVPLLAVGAGDGVFAAFAVGSWLLVTPDAASSARAAAGAVTAALVVTGLLLARLRERAPAKEGAALWRDAAWTWMWAKVTTLVTVRAALVGALAICTAATVAMLPLAARTPFVVAVASFVVLSATTRHAIGGAPT